MNDDKSYNRNFFTTYTIDRGLSFDVNKSIPWPIIFVWHHITFSEDMSSVLRQVSRVSALG